MEQRLEGIHVLVGGVRPQPIGNLIDCDKIELMTKQQRAELWDRLQPKCKYHLRVRCLKSSYVNNRQRVCSLCNMKHTKQQREILWDTTFISCSTCSNKCQRSRFVWRKKKICALCARIKYPSFKKYKTSPQGIEQTNAARRSYRRYLSIKERAI